MKQAHCKANMGEGREGGTVRQKLSALLQSDSAISPLNATDGEISSTRNSSASSSGRPGYASDLNPVGSPGSPYMMSPWIQSSPYMKSPWSRWVVPSPDMDRPACWLVASMVRQEGHVYSLATAGGLLYTGSDGKNIRVWKNQREFSGFKSNSGLVKAIIVVGGKIFSGHQDGKIRVWRSSSKNPSIHKQVGTLPTLKELLKSSLNPSNYVEVRRRRNSVWLRHFDAVSCLSLDQEEGLLYSGSWDKTVKVWRITDSKCLESIKAHDDAVNTVVAAGFDSMLLTGSADGTVKVWRREARGRKSTRHVMVEVLLKLGSAVTALAVCAEARVIYSGSSDGSVNVWEKPKQMVHTGLLRGHKLAVLCVAAAGSLVFSGSADKTISVWRREGGGEHTWMAVLRGHEGPVKCLAVEEEEERRRWVLYSGSLDRSVKVWKVAEEAAEMRAVLPCGSSMDEEFAFPFVGRGTGVVALVGDQL